MPKYVIERDIPGAGRLSSQALKAISQKSCGVLSNMGPQIQWLQSFVTGDKIYCLYIAPDEQMVRDHPEQGGFPANKVRNIYGHRPNHGGVAPPSRRLTADTPGYSPVIHETVVLPSNE